MPTIISKNRNIYFFTIHGAHNSSIFHYIHITILLSKKRGVPYVCINTEQLAMNLIWILMLIAACIGASSQDINTRPYVVNIGALFTLGSPVGRVSNIATEAAVDDVNDNPNILKGTKLKLTTHDMNYSGFLGIVEALRFMEGDTVAIIGPQSSVIAHVISNIANELQVPLLSFAASDPSLTSLQYPFFIMTAQSDQFQMAAIAEIISHYEWREVIAIYIDDDYGRNGIGALGDKLAEKRCKISYKAALSSEANREEVTNLLVKLALMESRILVLHTYATIGLEVLDVAQLLGMKKSGYVWIATNWLSTVLDIDSPLPSNVLNNMQGVLTFRIYTRDSKFKRTFTSRWRNLTNEDPADARLGLNTYALFAYDTVWILAHAIDAFFKQGGNISFSNDTKLSHIREGTLNLNAMSMFNGGNLLRQNILNVNFTGLTGPIQFTSDRCLTNPAYEVLNVIGTGYRKIGYWSNHSGLSVVPPEKLYTKKSGHYTSDNRLYDVIWPGQITEKPRGWVFPNNGRHLLIGVPNRVSYPEFISLVKGTDIFKGYCIEVFTAAVSLLPYAVPYRFVAFGDGLNNPSCTELVRLMTAGVYDAAVGDIAIITNRTRLADFTQPYIESGLVVVAPVRKLSSDALAFLKPFTRNMWAVTGVSFLVIGTVIWILEHRINDQFRGPPKRQIVTIFWFSFSTMFFAHKENTVSTLGRMVLIIWLFVVLIINSSYTASLTSILTVQQLSSSIEGIENLISSNDPIGYQHGSFALNYLTEELGIHKSRLVALSSAEDYAKALRDGPRKKGGVAAVVDERAYVELFLSTRCEFTIVGQEFTKSGWGFAFPRDSQLAIDMSTAILKLSENGDLQRIHDKWLMGSACSSQGKQLEGDRLQLKSFWGLFVICGLACFLSLLIYLIQTIRQFSRHYSEEDSGPALGRSSQSTRLQTFLSFADEREDEIKSRSKKRKVESGSIKSIKGGETVGGSSRRPIDISSNGTVNRATEV